MKLFWMLLTAGMLCGAQEMEQINLYYTGKLGHFFRDWPLPPAIRYRVLKTNPDELNKLLNEDKIRLAVTTVPLRKPGLKTVKFAYQAIILAVHPANRMDNISLEQARSILEKNKGSWRTFGGPSARLHLYVKARPELPPPVMRHGHTHGRPMPRTILEPEPLGGKTEPDNGNRPSAIKYSQPLKIQTESDAKSFSMLCTDPLGMACFDITRYDENRVHILSVDKIPPTLENFRYGSYPLLTVYYLTTPINPTPAEQNLIGYLWSRRFAVKLFQSGLLPEKR